MLLLARTDHVSSLPWGVFATIGPAGAYQANMDSLEVSQKACGTNRPHFDARFLCPWLLSFFRAVLTSVIVSSDLGKLVQ